MSTYVATAAATIYFSKSTDLWNISLLITDLLDNFTLSVRLIH
jgi:hypothetical protein